MARSDRLSRQIDKQHTRGADSRLTPAQRQAARDKADQLYPVWKQTKESGK